jgi:transposase-like protein
MRIIEETLAPGAVVTEIARRHGIATSLVFTWRRRARLATVASAGPRLVLALGVIRRDIDLSGADGLYAGRDRLEKSTTDMATAERRLSEIKYWTTCILGRHKSLNL